MKEQHKLQLQLRLFLLHQLSSFVINDAALVMHLQIIPLLIFLLVLLNLKIQSMIGRQHLELVLPLLRLTPLKRVMYRLQLEVDLDMHLVLVLTFGLIILLDLVIQSLSTQLQLVELMFTWLLVNMVISLRSIGYGQTIDSSWTQLTLREDRFNP